MAKLPDYVGDTDPRLVVQDFCHGRCNGTRCFKLNKAYFNFEDVGKADSGYTAICLKCGFKSEANYHFSQPHLR